MLGDTPPLGLNEQFGNQLKQDALNVPPACAVTSSPGAAWTVFPEPGG